MQASNGRRSRSPAVLAIPKRSKICRAAGVRIRKCPALATWRALVVTAAGWTIGACKCADNRLCGWTAGAVS
jgi:hypothetical protein